MAESGASLEEVKVMEHQTTPPVFTIADIDRAYHGIPLERFDASGFGSTAEDAAKCARMRIFDEFRRILLTDFKQQLRESGIS